ncbi:MAG: hypothetical protein LBI59_09285 [Candidatus Accumulibacter sp.]|jgi:hypothetical protein|nr:hypothetical protein [Accumulibacter sp.]
MKDNSGEHCEAYFPAMIRAEYDSPVDALAAGLRVPYDEALDLAAAAWASGQTRCILTRIDGGRQVAAILLPNGRWAACNAFTGQLCATPREAERRLGKLLRRGRRGTVGAMPATLKENGAGS